MNYSDTDQKKIDAQQEFVRRLHELLEEFPGHTLYGDRNGDVVAHVFLETQSKMLKVGLQDI